MRWRRWLIGSIVLAVLLVVSWFVCKPIYLGYSAERDYSLTLFVLKLIEDYVTEHGEWPKSWHDLEQVKRTEPWDWPKDSGTVQGRIAVDFNVNLNELAGQSVDQFQAIRPIHPNVLFNDDNLRKGPVESLLKTVRRLTKENNEAAEKRSN
jgi:hypothetical protein